MRPVAFGQEAPTDTAAKKKLPPVDKFYVGGAFDGAIFSTATLQNTTITMNPAGVSNTFTENGYGKLRFSYFINFGFTFNFNFGRHFGMYTGIDMKNIGYIDNDATGDVVKRRVYTLGVPAGIKVGNMARKGHYIFAGGGADAPFNYKEKSFEIRDQKKKFNEWFSSRTPAVMPYVFLGGVVSRGVVLKAQYYPGNFMNPDYISNGVKPYQGFNVHLILFSLGISPNFSRHHDIVETKIADLKTT